MKKAGTRGENRPASGLMPVSALVEELAGRALHPRRRDEVLSFESIEVGFHLVKQTCLLFRAHGRQSSDDHLGVLELDQVMELNAGFLLTCVVTVEDGVAAGLDLSGVCDPFSVGRGGAGLVVDNLSLLNQIEDADQPG